MRDFIRIHPWRLEIVPAAAILLAFGSLLCYRGSSIAMWMRAEARLENHADPLSYMLMCSFAFALSFWIMEIGANHNWIMAERDKRFNRHALLMQAAVLVHSSLIFLVVRIAFSLPYHYLALSETRLRTVIQDMGLLGLLLIIGLGTTSLLEATRKCIPDIDSSEPHPPQHLNTPYVEVEIDWLTGLAPVPLVVAALLVIVNGDSYGAITLLTGAVLGVVFVSGGARRKVTIDDRSITLSAGVTRRQILFSEIESCQPSHRMPFPKRQKLEGKRKGRVLLVTTGRCLEITTKSGDVYHFGIVRLQYACSLIEAAIAREQSDK